MTNEIRTNIARAALAVARHVHDGGYEAVIVSGGSHQLSRSLLALGWGVLYPDEPIRKTFVLDAHANELLYKFSGSEAEAAQEFSAWVSDHVPELKTMKNAPLVFVDDFAISGHKYIELRDVLSRAHGFRHLSFAFFAAKESVEVKSDAFIGVRNPEVLSELHRLGQHIQGQEEADELLRNEIHSEAQRVRGEALEELREVGRSMRR